MNPLTLDEALQLYDIIGKYLPEIEEDIDAMDFIGTIVKSVSESDQPQNYVDAIMLMSEKTLDELQSSSSEERISMFIDGLSVNKIIELESFCNTMGYSNG
jgi:hypothetical protein